MPDFGTTGRESSVSGGNVSNGEGSASSGGVMGSVRQFLDSLANFLGAKADLIGVELQEEKRRIFDLIWMAAILTICVALGFTLLAFAVVVYFWNDHPVAALLTVAGVYLAIGGFFGIRLKRKASFSTKIFATSREEFQKDREWLHRHF